MFFNPLSPFNPFSPFNPVNIVKTVGPLVGAYVAKDVIDKVGDILDDITNAGQGVRANILKEFNNGTQPTASTTSTSATYSTSRSTPNDVSCASPGRPTQANRSLASNEKELEKYAKLMR